MKRTSFIAADKGALAAIGPVALLAEAEGLPAHAHSISVRLEMTRNSRSQACSAARLAAVQVPLSDADGADPARPPA